MLRSFVVAFVTIAAVSVVAPRDMVHAQAQNVTDQYKFPLDMVGATPGVSIEIILNGQKQGDAAADATGNASWVLELVGKSQVTIYVDVCKDGKIVKVMFVTGGGQAPPEDESCRRRLAAMSFQSDCGVIRINIDFRNWGARIVGCAAFYTRPQFYGPVGGLVVALPFLLGGDDAPTLVSTPTTPTVTAPPVTAPPVTAPPPTNTTNPNPPAPTPPSTPTDFTASIPAAQTFHPPGSSTSIICGIVMMSPAISGATWVLTASGPGVLPNQNVNGNFNANGQAPFRIGIASFGPYVLQVTITANNVMGIASANHNVTSASGNCP